MAEDRQLSPVGYEGRKGGGRELTGPEARERNRTR